jgi:GTPase SAR1 family protein
VFLGESAVGKTSIINRLLGNNFCETHMPSINNEIHLFKDIVLFVKELFKKQIL